MTIWVQSTTWGPLVYTINWIKQPPLDLWVFVPLSTGARYQVRSQLPFWC